MAKIENTTVYPTIVPAMDDLLIATDVSNNNETVTFLVSDLIGGAGVLQGLQSVLDTGNTATQNILLQGVGAGGGITVVGTVYPTTITASGSTGVAGQILSSTGTGIQWINSPTLACCSWDDTLAAGNVASNYDAEIQGKKLKVGSVGGGIDISTPATLTNTGTSTFSGQVAINGTQLNFNSTGQINDGAGSTGTPGQWLTATATGVAWSSTIPAGSCCDLQNTLNAGHTANNIGMTFTGASSITMATGVSIGSAGNNVWSGNNTFSGSGLSSTNAGIAITGTLYAGASVGAIGDVLTSTGTGVQWAAASGGTTPTLQTVLDTAPFGATGANANVTISGYLDAGSIKDNSGGTGAVGQFLGISGAGLTWTTIPTGTVSSISLGSVSASTGLPIVLNAASPVTGAVTITQRRYTGGTNEGCVPTGSGNDATKYLDGTGNWTVPAAGGTGVTSFTNVNGTFISAGTANTAATGAVTMGTIDLSATGTPSATTFLRGDNTWAVPAGGTTTAPEEVVKIFFYNPKWEPTALGPGNYFTFDGITQGGTPSVFGNNVLGATIPTGSTTSAEDYFAGQVWGYGPAGSCGLYGNHWLVCSVRFQVMTDTNTGFYFQLWKGPLCPTGTEVNGSELKLIANCEFAEAAVNQFNCCDATLGDFADRQIAHNEAIFMTLSNGGAGGTNITFQGNCYINFQKGTI